MMPPLAALGPYQRKGYQSIIDVCRENRAKMIYLRELLRMAEVRPKAFQGIVTNLRLANEYDALCELRSALGLVEIEDFHLDRAIEKMDLVRELHQPEGPRMKSELSLKADVPKTQAIWPQTEALPVKAAVPSGFSEKQKVFFDITGSLAKLQPSDQMDVWLSLESWIHLGVLK